MTKRPPDLLHLLRLRPLSVQEIMELYAVTQPTAHRWLHQIAATGARLVRNGPASGDTYEILECTRESHEAAVGEQNVWGRWTPLGTLEGLEYRNCPVCGSTITKALKP